MKYSIIIPNYNGKELLKKNLPSLINLLKRDDNLLEIIVVDDASNDQSIEFVKKKYPDIKLLINKENKGFAYSCNRGVEKAKGEVVILLNTDAVFKNKTITDKIDTYFKNDDVFAVGFLDIVKEKGEIQEHGRGIGYFKKGWFFHKKASLKKGYSLWASGGSSAFCKEKWDKLNGFDTIYSPFYWEDVDLGFRGWLNGYKIYFDPDIKVAHNHEKGSIKSNYEKKQIEIISYRNQFLFNWKYFNRGKYLLKQILGFFYYSFFALMANEWTFFKGFFSALKKIKQLNKKKFDPNKFQDKNILEI